MRLSFLKLLEKLAVNIHLIRAHFKERSAEDFMRSALIDAYAILFSDYHFLNCHDLRIHNIRFYKEVDKSTLAVI